MELLNRWCDKPTGLDEFRSAGGTFDSRPDKFGPVRKCGAQRLGSSVTVCMGLIPPYSQGKVRECRAVGPGCKIFGVSLDRCS